MKLNLNDPKFVNSLVNYSWMYCFNADCPRTAECIRFISAKFKPDDVTAGNAVFPDANLHSTDLAPISSVCDSSRRLGDSPISTTR